MSKLFKAGRVDLQTPGGIDRLCRSAFNSLWNGQFCAVPVEPSVWVGRSGSTMLVNENVLLKKCTPQFASWLKHKPALAEKA